MVSRRWGARSADGGRDLVPVPGVEGSLWLCGKHHIGPAHDTVLSDLGLDLVVCLTEAHEIDGRYAAYGAWLRSGDPRARWVPVPDLTAPVDEVATDVADDVLAVLAGGGNALVHCAAGIGRAGTMAAVILVRAGLVPVEALATVAASRPMAGPEAGSQADLVHRLGVT